MTAIVCDMCKKAVPAARKDVSYIVMLDKDICMSCSDQLLEVTKQQMKTKRPYLYKDYQDSLVGNLAKMCR